MDRGLAYRRHQEEKAKERARKRLQRRRMRLDNHGRPISDKDVGRFAETPKPCSCPMCGNPRRHFGEPTLQEKKNRRSGRAV